MKGIILFYKPKGISSYDVIRLVKKMIVETHIGHGGALDPLAEGLLILGVGREATHKLNQVLKKEEKEYEAVVRLGEVSETYDGEGPITEISNFQFPSSKDIEKTLKNFTGEIWQTPPLYSAVKIKGRPAYAWIRKGKKIQLKSKKVFVKSIEILKYELPNLYLRMITGSGFYIRSFAHDLGQSLGCGGYLIDLKRIRVGCYTIDRAINFDDMKKDFIEFWAEIFGNVQNVGFRFFAVREAKKFSLAGWVRNTERGTVEVLAQGKEKSLQQFLEKLKQGSLLAKVEKVDCVFQKPTEIFSEFFIKQ